MNGWTGGQYSLVRVLFGAYLCARFAALPFINDLDAWALVDGDVGPLLRLFPNVLMLADGPAVVASLILVGWVASIFLAIGYRDRYAAIAICYVLVCLFGRNSMSADPSLLIIGILLLVHACLPRAPYGAQEARARIDPSGGWHFSPSIFRLLWILMALLYSAGGLAELGSSRWRDGTALSHVLEGPMARPGWLNNILTGLPDGVLRAATWTVLALDLGFVLFALIPRLRPFAWSALLLMHIGLIAVIDNENASLAFVMLHLFTFDPRWVRPRHEGAAPTLFYDGTCGLCHSTVRWILAEDSAERVRFAPLQGETFVSSVPAELRGTLPDSVVLQRADGTLAVRSRAVLELMGGLGGLWGAIAWVSGVIPAPIADLAYDLVARQRRKLWARPNDLCPLLPPQHTGRFLA